MDSTLRQAAAGAGGCLIISGVAGIGKSRLLREAQRKAAARGFTILSASCEEPDGAVAFGGVTALLRSRLSELSQQAFAAELGPPGDSLAHLLPEIRSEPGKRAGREAMGGEGRQAICEAVCAWLAQRAQAGPLLVTLEDIHWCDDASLLCLATVLTELRNMPVLFLMSLRTSPAPRDQKWAAEQLLLAAGAQNHQLQPLSRSQVGLVMRDLSPTKQAPPFYFLAQVFDVTGGNPLFVEEMCLTSTATDDVSKETDLLGLHPRPQAAIPRSIRRIIRQRAQGLSAEAQALADLCAVHGRVFDLRLVQTLMKLSEEQLWERCGELVRAHLALQLRPGVYAFRHALVREALYDRLLVRERRALHERLAIGLEQLYEQSIEEHLAALTYHAFKAGCWRRTLTYCRIAAETALALDAPRTAVAQLTRAIEAASWLADAPSWGLHCMRAEALARLGDCDGALTDYATALDSARLLDDRQALETVFAALTAFLPALQGKNSGIHFGQIAPSLAGENGSGAQAAAAA